MHQHSRLRPPIVRVTYRRLFIGLFIAGMLAVPAMVYASNSNPLCLYVDKYSIEWYVLFCNYTEIPGGSDG